jgi:hypothetical protein
MARILGKMPENRILMLLYQYKPKDKNVKDVRESIGAAASVTVTGIDQQLGS